jgi:hypothetical protein
VTHYSEENSSKNSGANLGVKDIQNRGTFAIWQSLEEDSKYGTVEACFDDGKQKTRPIISSCCYEELGSSN